MIIIVILSILLGIILTPFILYVLVRIISKAAVKSYFEEKDKEKIHEEK